MVGIDKTNSRDEQKSTTMTNSGSDGMLGQIREKRTLGQAKSKTALTKGRSKGARK